MVNENKREENNRAAIYCRVSTEEQAKGDFTSLDSQEKILINFAKSHNLKVYKVYQDAASGENLNRSAYNQMMNDAEDGKFKCIMVTRLDRISRNLKDFLNLSDKLDILGISLKSHSESIDTSTSFGRHITRILIMFGQMERERSNERTREKMVSMIKEGYWTGGLTPLGYDLVNKKLVINRSETKLVNDIFNYYLELPSTLQVAKKLNSLGFKTKKRTSKDQKVRGGGPFTKSVIAQILRNVIYIGKRKYQNDLFEGKHEPIVSNDLFNRVQKRLDLSKYEKHITRTSILPHSLTGIVECGLCGSYMTSGYAKPRNKKYFLYRCTSRVKDTKLRCSAKDIKQEDLDNFIQVIIRQLVHDEKFFDSVFKKIKFNSSKGVLKLKENYSELMRNDTSIKTETTNIINSLAQIDSERIRVPLLEKLEELEKNKELIENELFKLKEKISDQEGNNIDRSQLLEVFNIYLDNYNNIDVVKKKKINQLIFEKIIVKLDSKSDDGEVIIKIRSNGEIKRNWNELKSPKLESSSFRRVWYPREESNLRPKV